MHWIPGWLMGRSDTRLDAEPDPDQMIHFSVFVCRDASSARDLLLARNLYTVTAAIEQQSMTTAAHTGTFPCATRQRQRTVRAPILKRGRAPLVVAEHHDRLIE